MIKWGIRTRLIISYLVLIILALILLGSYILWFFYHHNLESLTSKLLTQAHITEELVKTYMHTPSSASLDEQIKQLACKINLHITVLHANGSIVAASTANYANTTGALDHPEILSALAGEIGKQVRYNSVFKENWLYVAVPVQENGIIHGIVCVSTSLAYVETGFSKIKSALCAALFFATLIAIVLSIRLAKKFTAPLEQITHVAEQFSQGKLDLRVHIRTGDEMEILAHTLNHLASKLDDKVSEIVAEKKKLELILEHMDNAVILLDKYSRITKANHLAVETFGITKDMLGRHNINVIGNSLLDRTVNQCLSATKHNIIHLKTNTSDRTRIFQVFIAPILTTEKEVNGILCVFHDITVLQELQERQADFIANASHELATPLTVIKGFAETLLDGALHDHELSLKFVEIIHKEAQRMHRLVGDLLQLAQLESHDYRQHVKIMPLRIDNIFENIMDELAPQWQRKAITYVIEYSPQLTLVMANYDWLKQLLVNLVENAIKYAPEKGKLLLKYYQEDNSAHFIVQDNGPGIPAKDLPFIFERFYRVDKSRTRSAGGTGLGLAIVKFIVDILNGKITVKSNETSGTSFIVTLPLAQKR